MNLGIVTIVILSVTAALAGWLTGRETFPLPAARTLAKVLGPVAILGAVLLVWESRTLQAGMARLRWPTVSGTVITSERVADGPKNYKPLIRFSYQVEGAIFHNQTMLKVPGFGPKSNKEDVADKLVLEYPVGRAVKVYYNPLNPVEADLRPGPGWDIYGRFAFGACLYGAALWLLAARLWGRRATPLKG